MARVFPFYNGKHYLNPGLTKKYKVLLVRGEKVRTLINAFLHLRKSEPVQLNKTGIELVEIDDVLIVYETVSNVASLCPDFILHSASTYDNSVLFGDIPHYYRVLDSVDESEDYISTATPTNGFKSKEFEFLIANLNLELEAIDAHEIDLSSFKFLEFDGTQSTSEMLEGCEDLLAKNRAIAETVAVKYLNEFKGTIVDFKLEGLDSEVQTKLSNLVEEVKLKTSNEYTISEYRKTVIPIIDIEIGKKIDAPVDLTKYKTFNSNVFVKFDKFTPIYKTVKFNAYPDVISERRQYFRETGIGVSRTAPANSTYISVNGLCFMFSPTDAIVNVIKELGVDKLNTSVELYLKEKYSMDAIDLKLIYTPMINEFSYKFGMYLKSRAKYYL